MAKNNEKEGLLPIGVVAQSFGVSENNLRRMEAAGLLVPAYVSKKSGYRYYDTENVSRIATILSLKSFGFVYDDMREHFQHPGDYTELYDKLVEKRKAITLQINKMRRFIKNSNIYQCETVHYAEMYCLTKKVRMVPRIKNFSELVREFIYEAIKEKYPVNYTRAILIITECADYNEFDRNAEQELTFCIPLRCKAEGDDIRYIPGYEAVALTWSPPMGTYGSFVSIIDNVFNLNGLKQSDTIRAAYDIGGHMGKDIGINDTIMHILVPFE